MSASLPVPYEQLWTTFPGAPRYLLSGSGRVVSFCFRTPRERKTSTSGQYGYPALPVKLTDGSIRTLYIHRAVAVAFRPATGGALVRHLDGNQANNRADNLAWGTHSDNYADRRRHGTSQDGPGHHRAKLSEIQVREIRARHRRGASQRSLSLIYGVSPMTVNRIVNRTSWRTTA